MLEIITQVLYFNYMTHDMGCATCVSSEASACSYVSIEVFVFEYFNFTGAKSAKCWDKIWLLNDTLTITFKWLILRARVGGGVGVSITAKLLSKHHTIFELFRFWFYFLICTFLVGINLQILFVFVLSYFEGLYHLLLEMLRLVFCPEPVYEWLTLFGSAQGILKMLLRIPTSTWRATALCAAGCHPTQQALSTSGEAVFLCSKMHLEAS